MVCVLAFGQGGALASSYGGAGDWTIGAGTTEVVSNETVTVLGDVTVLGNLTLEDSTLLVRGRPFPDPPFAPVLGLFYPGDVRVGANANLVLNRSTLRAYHAVNVAGRFNMSDSTFNISGDDGARYGPGVTSGFFNTTGTSLAVNSSLDVLGRAFVTGTLTLVNSSLLFGTDPYVNGTAPFGIWASGTVSLADADGLASTTADASVLGASGNGSYSTFGNGARFTMLNSRGEYLGEGGYPGLEFNRSQVTISGSTFIGPAGRGGAVAALDGLRAAVVFNNVTGGTINDTSFAGVALPIIMRGGVQNRVERVNITAMVAGVQLLGEYYTEVNDLTVGPSFAMPGLAAWPSLGTAIAIRNGSNITVQRLLVEGNATLGQFQPLSGILAEGVDDLVAEDVTVRDASALITADGPGWLILNRVRGERVGGGVLLADFTWARLNEASVQGDAPVAFLFVGCQLVEFGNSTGNASIGVEFRDSAPVFVRNVSVSVRQAGLRFFGDRGLTVSRLTVEGNGTGLTFVTASEVLVKDSVVEFGLVGLNALYSTDMVVQNVSFRAAPDSNPDVFLRLTSVFRFTLLDWNYSGRCDAAGAIGDSGTVFIDRFVIGGCRQGLAVTSTSQIDLPWADLQGVTAGTALGFYNVTDAWVGGADVSGAYGVGLAILGSSRVYVSSFNASGAGGSDGVIVAQSGDIELSDGLALGASSWGVTVVNATGPVTLTRLRVSGGQGGVAILNSPGATLVDCDVSMSGGDGVSVDGTSQGAVLRNLTLAQNAGAGLRMDAAGATLTDGNISANQGDGIAPGANVRLDWHVEVAASFTDGQTRFTGDLLVSPGASFVARRAAFHFDPGPRQVALSTPPLFELLAGARAVLDRVTFDSTNASVPYTFEMSTAASVEILASSFAGSGRGLYASAIRGSTDFLAVRNSTFVGFSRPLEAFGSLAELSDVNYSNNDAGPRLAVQSLTFFNLTVENSAGVGLEVLGVPWVRGERLLARGNGGVGARFSNVDDLALATSEVYENLQGGLLLESCVAALTHTSVAGNSGFGLRLQGGGRASIDDLHVYGNSGSGLAAEDLDELRVDGALVYNGLGRGVDLARVSVVTLDRAEFYDNGAFGLTAVDVGNLTVVGVRFAGNAVSQVVLQGWTVALFVDGVLERSPGDAVALNGTASGTFIAVAADAAVARVAASERSYAYLLNSTFAAPFVLDAARVDVAWNLSVVVWSEAGTAVPGATVTVGDAQGGLVASEGTGADGSTRTFTVMAKNVFAGGSILAFSPHSFNASLAGGGGARLSVDVDRYMVVNLTADGTAPVTTITLEGAAGEGGWFLGPVTARLHAADASDYGVTLFWRVDSGPWRSGSSAGAATEEAVAVDAEGVTLLEYYAVDGVANAEEVRSALVKVDLNAPTARFENLPANATAAEYWVRWNASDTGGSFCCSYQIERADGDGPFRPWGDGRAAPSDRALFTPDAEGEYHFRLTATDGAGRESRPVTGTLDVRLNGTLRISVADADGRPLPAATIQVGNASLPYAGAGPFDIRLAPGTYRVTVSAPGFVPRTFDAVVAARNVTDLGVVELVRQPQAVTGEAAQGPLQIVLLLVSVGAAATIWFFRRSRRKPA